MSQIVSARITTPAFIGYLAVREGEIACTSPELEFLRGWSVDNLNEFCRRKAWLLDYQYETQTTSETK